MNQLTVLETLESFAGGEAVDARQLRISVATILEAYEELSTYGDDLVDKQRLRVRDPRRERATSNLTRAVAGWHDMITLSWPCRDVDSRLPALVNDRKAAKA